jgi:hypothetical protein
LEIATPTCPRAKGILDAENSHHSFRQLELADEVTGAPVNGLSGTNGFSNLPVSCHHLIKTYFSGQFLREFDGEARVLAGPVDMDYHDTSHPTCMAFR